MWPRPMMISAQWTRPTVVISAQWPRPTFSLSAHYGNSWFFSQFPYNSLHLVTTALLGNLGPATSAYLYTS